MKKLKEFLDDTKDYNLFSYEEYKSVSLELKLKKIALLNEYAKLKYGENILEKLDVYIDFDGVILDTMRLAREILKKEHGIDWLTHNRSHVENERIVTQFFSNLNWKKLIHDAEEINKSTQFIQLMKQSIEYTPTIYSSVGSKEEEEVKRIFLKETVQGISQKYGKCKVPKTCEKETAVLIDDDDFNLKNWPGRPIHFDSGRKSIFPSITDLGEIYYLFTGNNLEPYPYLYDNYKQIISSESGQKIWVKK